VVAARTRSWQYRRRRRVGSTTAGPEPTPWSNGRGPRRRHLSWPTVPAALVPPVGDHRPWSRTPRRP